MPFIIHKIPARTSPFHALFEKEFTDSGMKQHESKEKERPKDKNDMAYLKAIRILDAQIKNDDVLLKKLKVLRDLFKLTENLRLHYRIYAKTDAKNDLKVPLYTTEDEP